MDTKQKVLTATAFAALLSGGVLSQSFAHAAATPATSADAGPDPFHNPDFSHQKAIDYFQTLEHVSLAHDMSPTFQSLDEIILSAPLTVQAQTALLDIKQQDLGHYAGSNDHISQADFQNFTHNAQGYLELSLYGFENVQYKAPDVGFKLEKGQICGTEEPLIKNSKERLKHFKEKLSPVPAAQKTFKQLEKNKVNTEFKKIQHDIGKYYGGNYVENGVEHKEVHLMMNKYYNDNDHVETFFHESRHAKQFSFERHNWQIEDLRLSPVDLIWYTRIVEADAASDAVLQQMIMKVAGDPSCFDYNHENSPFGKLYDAAMAAYREDPASLQDGRLKRDVFDTWFTIDAIKNRAYDGGMLSDNGWQLRDQNLAKQNMPKGEMTRERLEGFGKKDGEEINYLTLKNYPPIDDPYYKGNYSPINQKKLDKALAKWNSSP